MKRLLITCLLCAAALAASAQAKKPTIMVMPSDLWCNTNGYMTTYDNQGVTVSVPDYQRALQTDVNLLPVIAKINDLMADRGFPLKNLESEVKDLNRTDAEMSMLQSRSGGSVNQSPIDRLRQQAKADIIIFLTWNVNQTGPKKSVTYTLQGVDSYTNKQVAGDTGTGAPSFTAELPLLLEQAVNTHIDNFADRLQAHFDDMFANGREISILVNVFDTSPVDLESEIDGRELSEYIDDWMADHTVNGRYSLEDATENYMRFEQVRIPMYDERERAMDANRFARELTRYLKGAPCNIPQIKQMNQGLGRVTLVLGDK
ncbi:DUF6175 family protein [Alistipes sp.]|uniref:DUF6175 family protein n=1 Tax=Alistipes sp. TaxID=1872444 RepID=UPI003AF11A80